MAGGIVLCVLCVFVVIPSLPSQERIQDRLFRPRNHMSANQFAISTGGLSTRIDGCTDGADVAPDKSCHISAANLNLTGQRDVRRLAHGVGRSDSRNQALGFDQAQGFMVAVISRIARSHSKYLD